MPFSLPDQSSALNISYFIFEFRQGCEPRVIHQYRPNSEEKVDNDFLWYVVSTPITQDYNPFDCQTSSFSAFFENNHFVCYNSIVPDVEARGFSRSIGICIYSNKSIQNKLTDTGISLKISNLLTKTIKDSHPQFAKDMSGYLGALISTMDANQESAPVLEQKFKEAIYMLKGSEVSPDTTQKPRTPEYFTQINNDLRDIEKLIDIDGLVKELRSILSQFYYSNISAKIKQRSHYDERFPCFNFGPFTNDDISDFSAYVLENRATINSSRYKLLYLHKPKVFHHIIYCLLSGRTLVIEASKPDELLSFAQRLSIFIPKYFEDCLHVFSEPITTSKALEYAIAITPQIKREKLDYICILNTDNGYYEGPICPYSSNIYKLFDFTVKTESSFLLMAYERLKEFSYSVIRIYSSFYTDVPKNNNKLRESLDKFQFGEADDPILRYLTQIIVSGGNAKIMMLNNPAYAAVGIVAYYDGR